MLTDESLEFARQHIFWFYDTDFYPKPFEFKALWHSWEEVKQYLISTPIQQLQTTNPKVLPWLKAKGGYRVVHQLEPLDALIYTALVYICAADIEQARMVPSVACSYRISPTDSSFFAHGSGFPLYRNSCELLSSRHNYVLSTDISDFYNQIYLHRIANSIEAVSTFPKIGSTIENFLMRLNNKASQGIPVGPAASVVLAEAILIDIDQFIANNHVEHVRYVDDIRIFSDSQEELEEILERLVIYLHDQHRLSLSGDKTSIRTTDEFLHEELQNQYQLEKLEILNDIEAGNPYEIYEEPEDADALDDAEDNTSEDNLSQTLLDALVRAKNFGYVDLAVLRAIIRRAKSQKIPDLAELILTDIAFFRPVINDVALYLDSLPSAALLKLKALFSSLCSDRKLESLSTRVWMEWLLTRHPDLLQEQAIRKYVYSGNTIAASSAAIIQKNQAWAKQAKQNLLSLASWNRRASIYSLSALSNDEKNKFISHIMQNPTMTATDKWVCKWVKDGCPELDFVDLDDIFG
ncbi:RNA-directed DNA polymerase [Stutzerimonas balearica]|uniref:RNA-directed DNA polymerase n=1 Tax=Stutzerimonas balearica TaxID=74829 RepID=UPI00190964FD|nr:RNA-directed DNA polymerase [Stutzerimonas balearica]MBK3748483.1 hypothetical protein [Stutzerimonas balearica]MBK3826680.1 hypothetical protein [Stutzerimonas balearica]MBK3856370.1 hypothetical protein [Stutzerimonas balearica]